MKPGIYEFSLFENFTVFSDSIFRITLLQSPSHCLLVYDPFNLTLVGECNS